MHQNMFSDHHLIGCGGSRLRICIKRSMEGTYFWQRHTPDKPRGEQGARFIFHGEGGSQDKRYIHTYTILDRACDKIVKNRMWRTGCF